MQNKVFKYLSYVGLVGEGPDVGLELEKLQRKKEKKIEDSVSGNRAFRVVSFRGGGAKLTRRELIMDRTDGGGSLRSVPICLMSKGKGISNSVPPRNDRLGFVWMDRHLVSHVHLSREKCPFAF